MTKILGGVLLAVGIVLVGIMLFKGEYILMSMGAALAGIGAVLMNR